MLTLRDELGEPPEVLKQFLEDSIEEASEWLIVERIEAVEVNK